MDYKPLNDLLLGGTLRSVRLSKAALRTLLKQTDFFSRLPKDLGQARISCAAVLDWCQPVLDRLCPAPEAGWLRECYDELAHGLYPDPDRAALSRPARQAMEFYLTVLDWFLRGERDRCPYDPLTDLPEVTEGELKASRIQEEYPGFLRAVRDARLYALLRLGREIMPFDPASHTIGVHHVAVHIARQAGRAGLPVDVPLVSAAALSHDVGKFGCRGQDAGRIPYLHYYYTDQWLNRQGLPRIAHIAANHSTWDLEFENLSLESLILIYADFRVRGTRENGKEVVRIYSLAEAYDMIFSKLFDMTPQKQQRYKTVYLKLSDFERMLTGYGVRPEPMEEQMHPPVRRDPALLEPRDCLLALCDLTLEDNVRLMYSLSRDVVFGQLLEQARGEKNLHRIRTYLQIFEEFSTYMTAANKRRTLSLLYELLSHHQGDVRRKSAQIMGQILANSGPRYRKELPHASPRQAVAPAAAEFLTESVELWAQYVDRCLHPDYRIAAKHAVRISNSLKIIASSLFRSCEPQAVPSYLEPLWDRLNTEDGAARFPLLDALYFLPLDQVPQAWLGALTARLTEIYRDGDEPLRVLVLRRLELFEPWLDEAGRDLIRDFLALPEEEASQAVRYLRARVGRRFGLDCPDPALSVAELYLSNLKNAVHWLVKITQVDALCDDALRHPGNGFHTATHLSNLLSVSEHLPVRERAGGGLLRLIDRLPLDQQNEIIVDLLRELETGQDEISVYIPQYLGKLMVRLPEKELAECLSFLQGLIRASTIRTATASLRTLSQLLISLPETADRTADEILGILLAGVSHYDDTIHETALTVLCEQVLSEPSVPAERRQRWALRVGKKLLCLLTEPRKGRFTFFTRAAVLNHLYRFFVDCRVRELPFRFDAPRPVAFFPGTFDPFTAGHKRIVCELTRLGFEVFLAIDEFSWSKQPVAKLQRRQIASMSVADLPDVYLFPDRFPVNIAYPQELSRLAALFEGRELYLVTGSDVIENASAYRTDAPGSAGDYNHIVFLRDSHDRELLSQKIRGKLQVLTLPEFYETVSSTRIREYVDANMDISMLVDPMVQSYIYERNLYVRAPQYKQPIEAGDQALTYAEEDGALSVTLTRGRAAPQRVGGRTVRGAALYGLLGDLAAAEFLREHTSGRILLVERVEAAGEQDALLLLNELLVRSLGSDHTYALCPTDLHPALPWLLPQLGFLPVPGLGAMHYVDMRTPMALVLDVLRKFKEPHASDASVRAVVEQTRTRLRRRLAALFPGRLLLSFDALLLDRALTRKVRLANGVDALPPGNRTLGPCMCVPYGNILSGEIVPNTVTKSIHADKAYEKDVYTYQILPMPGYSALDVQVRTLAAFHRPVILVDDLLHRGHRVERLDQLFREEGLEIRQTIVGLLSGRGADQMALQGRTVNCVYFIPNLLYWFNESQLYPFLGGDSVLTEPTEGPMPSANLILPYFYPSHLKGASDEALEELSLCALENARDILRQLERCHQERFSTLLTIGRLAEVFPVPRAPYRGRNVQYAPSALPSSYLTDDLESFRRVRRKPI